MLTGVGEREDNGDITAVGKLNFFYLKKRLKASWEIFIIVILGDGYMGSRILSFSVFLKHISKNERKQPHFSKCDN